MINPALFYCWRFAGPLFDSHVALFSTASLLLNQPTGPIFDCHLALFSFDKNKCGRSVNELTLAQDEHRLDKFIATALRHHLIVLDELGFIPFSNLGAQLIFQFCSALYERVSLLVTTNLQFADWTQVFGNEKLTLALLDRLTHRAHIIEFVGESFRFRQRLQHHDRQTQATN